MPRRRPHPSHSRAVAHRRYMALGILYPASRPMPPLPPFPLDPIALRTPCRCGSTTGLLHLRAHNLVVTCTACRRFQYNAPHRDPRTWRPAPPS